MARSRVAALEHRPPRPAVADTGRAAPRGYGEGMRIVVKVVVALAVLGAALSAAGALAERAFVKARSDGRM